MTTVAPPTPRSTPTAAAPRKRTGRILYVASIVGAVWLIAGTVWLVMNALSTVDGRFSFVFMAGGLLTAVMLLPLVLVNVGIPAVVAVVIGSVVRRRVRALWARALVVATVGMTALLVPVAFTWRGTEWDQGLLPAYVGLTLGVGVLFSLAAVLPWRGGFASRRYDVVEAA